MPKRIQLSRRKGWRMPEGAAKVDRSTGLGNPFIVSNAVASGKYAPGVQVGGPLHFGVPSVEDAVACFAEFLKAQGPAADAYRARIPALRGLDLACWCRLCPAHADGKLFDVKCPDCAPCHVDVLGPAANA